MQSVNLVPQHCLERRNRRARIRTWIFVLAGGAVAVLLAGMHLTMQSGHLQRFQDHQQDLEGRLAELQRQRTILLAERGTLYAKARLLVAPLTANELPSALAELSLRAPEGIVLTRVELGRGDRRQGNAPLASSQAIAIEGYGPDEDQIHAFAQLVQQIPAWSDAQLQRSYRRDAGGDPHKHFSILRGGAKP